VRQGLGPTHGGRALSSGATNRSASFESPPEIEGEEGDHDPHEQKSEEGKELAFKGTHRLAVCTARGTPAHAASVASTEVRKVYGASTASGGLKVSFNTTTMVRKMTTPKKTRAALVFPFSSLNMNHLHQKVNYQYLNYTTFLSIENPSLYIRRVQTMVLCYWSGKEESHSL
jgi:hypothetical protein